MAERKLIMTPLISIKNLNKYYPIGKDKFHALRDVSIEIGRGEMVAIMGKSGSGKTTLLNIIGTLDSFDDGEYLYDGNNVAKMSDGKKAALRASEIGFVNQEFMLLNKKTATENVALPLYFNDTPYTRIRMRARAAISEMGIAEQANKKITAMSGGQKQRVAIARAIVIEPSLILADEPTGALDRATADEIISCIRRLNKENGITVVIVTHDSEVAEACDRVITIVDGQIT